MKSEWHNFKKGETYKADMRNGSGERKIHIVEVIDEGLTFCPHIVFRYYGRHKQWWHYEVKSAFMLTADIPELKSFINLSNTNNGN